MVLRSMPKFIRAPRKSLWDRSSANFCARGRIWREDYKGEGPMLHAVAVEKTKAPREAIISFS